MIIDPGEPAQTQPEVEVTEEEKQGVKISLNIFKML